MIRNGILHALWLNTQIIKEPQDIRMDLLIFHDIPATVALYLLWTRSSTHVVQTHTNRKNVLCFSAWTGLIWLYFLIVVWVLVSELPGGGAALNCPDLRWLWRNMNKPICNVTSCEMLLFQGQKRHFRGRQWSSFLDTWQRLFANQ